MGRPKKYKVEFLKSCYSYGDFNITFKPDSLDLHIRLDGDEVWHEPIEVYIPAGSVGEYIDLGKRYRRELKWYDDNWEPGDDWTGLLLDCVSNEDGEPLTHCIHVSDKKSIFYIDKEHINDLANKGYLRITHKEKETLL